MTILHVLMKGSRLCMHTLCMQNVFVYTPILDTYIKTRKIFFIHTPIIDAYIHTCRMCSYIHPYLVHIVFIHACILTLQCGFLPAACSNLCALVQGSDWLCSRWKAELEPYACMHEMVMYTNTRTHIYTYMCARVPFCILQNGKQNLCVYVCVCMHMLTYACLYIYIYSNIYIYIYICVCVCGFTYIHTYVHTYIHIYTYVHIYIYTHVYICIYIHSFHLKSVVCLNSDLPTPYQHDHTFHACTITQDTHLPSEDSPFSTIAYCFPSFGVPVFPSAT